MMDDIEMEGIATPVSSSSIGEAVSGRGQSVTHEGDGDDDDEDLYYIPERRPSLDLGPTPMDTCHWHFVDQASTPAMGYWSMTSEESSLGMDDGDGSTTGVQLNRADSFSTCYSYDSDDCEKKTPKAKCQDAAATEPCDAPELIRDPNETKHPSLTVPFTFKALCKSLGMLCHSELKAFKMSLWKRYPQSFNIPPHAMDIVDLVDRLLEFYDVELSLQITKTLLHELGQKRAVDLLQTLCLRNEIRYEVCEILKNKYSKMCEDSGTQGEKRPIDDIFTTLYMTPASDIGPNTEHEIVQIKQLGCEYDEKRVITTKDIFSTERLERSNKKFVVLGGPAGSGKSMTIRKLVHDWIEERSHQHITFMFPISFRDLKQFEGSKVSLVDVLNALYPATKKLTDKDYRCDDCKIMFIFDGFDEYSDSIDFKNTQGLFDHADAGTLNVLVVNILRGRLLFRGLFVIATRSPVDRYVPHDTAYSEINLLGFLYPDREEFFKKRFQDPDQAARVIAYISSYKTLRIMCHLPLFCHLVADEHESMFKEKGLQAELPRGITYMYTKLLLVLMGPCRRLRAPDVSPEKEREFLMRLGKVAFNMLEEGKYRIPRIDWKESEIDPHEAVTNSGLCMQFLIKPYVLFQENVFSFIHPTVQEYMAALYVFLSFTNHGVNIFEHNLNQKIKGFFKGQKVTELYKNAVDSSLSAGGKLDIFLRFLFGMAVKPNHDLLQPFCTSSLKWPTFCEDAAALIRKRMKENVDPDRMNNLRCCLEELGALPTEAATS